jgi:hypothetical protein
MTTLDLRRKLRSLYSATRTPASVRAGPARGALQRGRAECRRAAGFIAERGCRLTGKHHEIYLGDPRRSAPEKLRTILRQPVVQR